MPAAAVIPAPVAYINVVAVKKLVVGFLVVLLDPRHSMVVSISVRRLSYHFLIRVRPGSWVVLLL